MGGTFGYASRSGLGRTVFSTGQVARIVGVSMRTVMNWIDKGLLKGFKIPGGNDRRVSRSVLVEFLTEHGMPLDGLAEVDPPARILLVGCCVRLAAALRKALASEHAELQEAAGAFDAGRLVAAHLPAAAVLDLAAMGRPEGLSLARCLRQAAPDVVLVALAWEDGADRKALAAAGFTEVFQTPFDPALLAERLREVLP